MCSNEYGNRAGQIRGWERCVNAKRREDEEGKRARANCEYDMTDGSRGNSDHFRGHPSSCCALFPHLHLPHVVIFSPSRVAHVVRRRQRWQYDIAKFTRPRHLQQQHRRRGPMNPTRSRSRMPSAGLSTPSRPLLGDLASPSSAYQVPTLSASGSGWSAPPEQQQLVLPATITICQTRTDTVNTATKPSRSRASAIPNHKN